MSKSIYEKALKSVMKRNEVTDMSLVIEALEQAQKQAKLLKLYKIKSSFVFTPNCSYKEMSIQRLDIKIEELEK